MARPRLIAIAAFNSEQDRILGCYSTPYQALAAILAAQFSPPADEQLFYEEPDNANPKMIQVRFVMNREAHHLGRILVDRGNVDTILAELRNGKADG